MCSADNGLGQVNKAELSLDVLYAPVATLPPKREVKEGENVEVECKIASNPRPATIQVRNFNCTLYSAMHLISRKRYRVSHMVPKWCLLPKQGG